MHIYTLLYVYGTNRRKVYVHVYIYTHLYMYMYMYTYMHMYMYTSIHTIMHVWPLVLYMYDTNRHKRH